MQKKTWLVVLASATLFSCSQQDFKKGDDGLEYKIISDEKGKKVNPGEFMELEVTQYRNRGGKDSVLQDTRKSQPYFEALDSASMPPSYFKILSQVHAGDSLVIRILTDSAFKKNMDQMPPIFKKGDYLLTTIKIKNIFKTKEDSDKGRAAAMAAAEVRSAEHQKVQYKKDDEVIQAYLKKNNINAVKGTEGTYVQILTPGTGNNIDTSVVAKVFYTGKTLAGVTFDSNVDSSFNHMDPFMVNMTNDPSLGSNVITGWKDGLKLLNKGAKAKMYIPSTLAYGEQGAGEKIAPNSILVFDIEVADILDKKQAAVSQAELMKKMQVQMEEMQKKYPAQQPK